MADQGKTLITMTVPSTAVRGNLVDGAGAFSATNRAVGIVYDDADGETTGAVQTSGTGLVKLGATLSAGDLVVADASGDAVGHTEDTDVVNGTDHLVCGILIEGGNSGELRRMVIK
jgi:hypothetical protein